MGPNELFSGTLLASIQARAYPESVLFYEYTSGNVEEEKRVHREGCRIKTSTAQKSEVDEGKAFALK